MPNKQVAEEGLATERGEILLYGRRRHQRGFSDEGGGRAFLYWVVGAYDPTVYCGDEGESSYVSDGWNTKFWCER